MKQMQIHNSTDIVADIKQIIEQARKQAYASINTLMIQSNWLVGRRIVEEEQGGASRAEYELPYIGINSVARFFNKALPYSALEAPPCSSSTIRRPTNQFD